MELNEFSKIFACNIAHLFPIADVREKSGLRVPMKTFILKIDFGFINLSYVITNYDVDAK
jgi:hypothetical protein